VYGGKNTSGRGEIGGERAKRDFSTAQTDTFAGAKVEEKASVCFGRNDMFAAIPMKWQVCGNSDK
jgi:hypothetical protein